MLRSEYYRALDEQRQTAAAEKETLRERITGIQSDLAREEGRRIQVENEAEDLRRNLLATRSRLDERTAQAERDAAAARKEMETVLLSIERLKEELATAQAALARRDAEIADLRAPRETSTVLLPDVAFARNSSALAQAQKDRVRALADALTQASYLSVVGHAEPTERGNAWTLSAQRASEVAAYLASQLRLSPAKITVVGRGTEGLAAAGAAPNRRVEIIAIQR